MQSFSLEDCRRNIKETVDKAADLSNNKYVVMCTIPHRYDNPDLNHKIHNVNTYLSELVSKKQNFHLLEHDSEYHDYKKDGLHFNDSGIAKFALEIRHIARNINFE